MGVKVWVGVAVGVCVAVAVGVNEGVGVKVAVGVGVGAGAAEPMAVPAAEAPMRTTTDAKPAASQAETRAWARMSEVVRMAARPSRVVGMSCMGLPYGNCRNGTPYRGMLVT